MKKYYLYASISIMCWSTVATIVKLLLGTLRSIQVLFISSFFAALALLIFNVATKRIVKLKGYRVRDYVKTVLICIPGTLLYYVFYYTGTSKMLASQAFIVNYLWPIMSVVFACIILKERVTPVKLVAIFLSFAGVIIVIGKSIFVFDGEILLGALFCVLGAVSYGVFTALNGKSSYEKPLSMMISYFATFIITGVYLLITKNIPSVEPLQILGLAWNGAFTMAVANTMWMLALSSKNTAKISNLAYLTPFISLVWTSVFLKEKITLISILGLGVIMLGILIQLLYKDKGEKGIEKKGSKM